MPSSTLVAFTEEINGLLSRVDDPADVAPGAAQALPDLLARPDFLEDTYRAPSAEKYAQHLLYVHPEGAYSVVALVWLPGQATPIHDHCCWCVVGVLQGQERETSYSLRRSATGEWLHPQGTSINDEGAVSILLPPHENIHRVENMSSGTTISIHVYGADIARLGTSINQIFDQRVLSTPGVGRPVAWRAGKHRLARGSRTGADQLSGSRAATRRGANDGFA